MDDMFNIIILLGGVYILYAAVMLKTKGVINQGVMASRNQRPENCRDLEGFKAYMFPRTLGMGAFTVLVGMFSTVRPLLFSSAIPEYILILAFFGYLMYYIQCVRKAEKVYW